MSIFKALSCVICLTVTACGVSESNDDNSGSYGAPYFRVGIFTADGGESLTSQHVVYMDVGAADKCEYIRRTYDESVANDMREFGMVDESLFVYGDAFIDSFGTCWQRRESDDPQAVGQEFVHIVQDELHSVRLLISREPDFVPDTIEPARQWAPPEDLWEDVVIDPREFDLSTYSLDQQYNRYATVIQVRLTPDGHEIQAAVVRANDLGNSSAPPIDREIPSFED